MNAGLPSVWLVYVNVTDLDASVARVRELGGDQALDRILLGRFGTPAEVASVVCFLASRYGEYINGEIIHVDGVFTMA